MNITSTQLKWQWPRPAVTSSNISTKFWLLTISPYFTLNLHNERWSNIFFTELLVLFLCFRSISKYSHMRPLRLLIPVSVTSLFNGHFTGVFVSVTFFIEVNVPVKRLYFTLHLTPKKNRSDWFNSSRTIALRSHRTFYEQIIQLKPAIAVWAGYGFFL